MSSSRGMQPEAQNVLNRLDGSKSNWYRTSAFHKEQQHGFSDGADFSVGELYGCVCHRSVIQITPWQTASNQPLVTV
jgi:hypothetical protein